MKKGCFLPLLSLIFIFFLSFPCYSDVPQVISFQGRIVDANGQPLADGNYSMTFKIWDALAAGSQLWTETQGTVSVTNGLFSVLLGSVASLSSLTFNQDYWLEITVGASTYSPRQRITSSAFALNVPDLRIGTTKIADVAVTTAKIADNAVTDAKVVDALTISGGTVNNTPVGQTTAAAGSFTTLSSSSTTTLNSATTIGGVNVCLANGTNCSASAGGWTLNAPYVYLTTGTNSVGIGTATPGQKLDVVGGSIRTDAQLISTVATGTAPLAVSSTTKVANLNVDYLNGVASTGYVQIGPASSQADATLNSGIFLNKSGVSGNLVQLQTGGGTPTDKFVVGYNGIISTASVNGTSIVDGSVDTVDIATGAVNSSKIADGSIMDVDISATAAINWSKISCTTCIATGNIADNAVTDAKVVDALTISGGTVNSTPVGQTTAAAGSFTTLSSSSTTTLNSATTIGTKNVCLADGTNCPSVPTATKFVDSDNNLFYLDPYVVPGNPNTSTSLKIAGNISMDGQYVEFTTGATLTQISKGTSSSIRVTTPSGYTEIGPQNASWSHFITDRPAFYFNAPVVPNGNTYPYTNNTYTLGTSANRWSTIYGVNGDLSGNLTVSGGTTTLNNATSNLIDFGTAGVAAPSAASAGWKIKTYGNQYGLGIEGSTQWFTSGRYYKFYDSDGSTYWKNRLMFDVDNTLTYPAVYAYDTAGAATLLQFNTGIYNNGGTFYSQNQMYARAGLANDSATLCAGKAGSGGYLCLNDDVMVNGGWLRVAGGSGIYFEDYGGGWNMTDTTWIRAYNNKYVYTGGWMRADSGFDVGGTPISKKVAFGTNSGWVTCGTTGWAAVACLDGSGNVSPPNACANGGTMICMWTSGL